MVENFKNCIRNGLDFKGRASRREFWLFALANLIISIPLAIIGLVIGYAADSQALISVPTYIYSFIILLPSMAVSIRRLHDIGKSGWWLLICALGSMVMGIGSIVLIVLMTKNSDGNNKYGPTPGMAGAYGAGAGYGQQAQYQQPQMQYGGQQAQYQQPQAQYQQPQMQYGGQQPQPQYQQPQMQYGGQQAQYQQPQTQYGGQQAQYQQPQMQYGGQQMQYQQPQMQYQQPQAPAAASGFCTNCGSVLAPGSQFCTNCGAKMG